MSNCVHCGQLGHAGKCPLVKAVEYYENGSVKRVEYITPADGSVPIQYYPLPHYPATYPATYPFAATWYGTCAGSATGGTTICG